ncbi:MAG: hypothetical protein HRT58_20815 [Crocinitomicaceae bacterium]|nr:hypothetical protein [Flavobacteriales bacterium]NQZ38115.1 hypothetical protein [Crocinitomicaceae bacterium]
MHHSLKPIFLLLIVILSSCVKEEPTEELSKYQLQLVNSIGTPVSNPQGIASDQNNLWILSGEFNGDIHELTLYDPVNYTILTQYTYTNLIEVLGTGVFGITWDGTNVWISVAGQTNKLVKVDPGTGDILQVWGSPGMAGPDLEWDGEKIWITSGNGYIYKVDPTSGGSELFVNQLEDHGSGIAFRNGEMWVVDHIDNDIHIFNSTNGSYHGVIKDAINNNKGALCFHNNQLAVLNSGGIALYNVIE